jgi:lipopolysaccharide transport system ATP-binding protein
MGRVSVRSIGKKYKLYENRWGRLLEWLSGDRWVTHRADWVLRGVSFEVEDGESVGIIGLNGAGKSTLLRILTGTTLASEGSFAIDGRTAALLELGLGIHPEFSGWQNAVLACQLMGLSSEEIEDCLPRIREFSELGDHMDQPVRTYSTGMQVRLAFSVATAVRPDVLIIDEALSVGDAYFQHKSIARIRSFQGEGTSLLFVTHDPAAVKTLCERALLLDKGILVRDGPPAAVFDYYNAMIAKQERDHEIRQVEEQGRTMTRSGSKQAEIRQVELIDGSSSPRRIFRVGETVRICCSLRVNQAMPLPTVGFVIRDRLGTDVFGSNTFHLDVPRRDCAVGEHLVATFEVQLNVGPGNYSLTVALHSEATHLQENFDWWDQAAVFQVIPGDSFRFTGVAALPARAVVSSAAAEGPQT